MSKNITTKNLTINKSLYDFINNEALPGIKVNKDIFWEGFSKLIHKFGPINKKLLEKRVSIQDKIDNWHKLKLEKDFKINDYHEFLKKIGYLHNEGDNFSIETENVDEEIKNISGPQLVVPITNARYAINAVNARWGSLYDALYGTDVIGSIPNSQIYDSNRGLKVINYAKSHLDKMAPLKQASWNQIIEIRLEDNQFKFFLTQNSFTKLLDNNQISGYILDNNNKIKELVLVKNYLHCRIIFNANSDTGKNDPANISDIILESAISSILDCEDSVATVDADDKILAYRNWLGLMKGDLKSVFIKKNQTITRKLNNDIEIQTLSNQNKILKSRSLMLIRNVGHLMTTSAILDKNGEEVGEGVMDAMITAMIAIHDLNKNESNKNSLQNSIYIVKPKMHGPEEVSFTVNIFSYVEKILSLPLNTIKVGIMDEERRTSVNLKECIRAAKSRLAFINTGFLDRTGDEIHTSMFAGPFLKKGDMRNSTWIKAYELRNVVIGLKCGLQGRAQIGKGMWAMPDLMKAMVEQKIEHLKAGANCAWVPSPTAATLHALHYHLINVKNIQNQIFNTDKKDDLLNLLEIPLLNRKNLSTDEILKEIENNSQSILGYVVRWIDQGIGCSKVPDINNISLMEDRATCRISSQAISNWILHEIVTKKQVVEVLKKMAKVVDYQNKNDQNYIPMSPSFDTIAFKAAYDLVLNGVKQPSGYTEPILHSKRIEYKKFLIDI